MTLKRMVHGYDVAALAEEIRRLAAEFPENDELWVDTISPGWRGIHQVEDVAEFFGIDVDPNDVWPWDDVEDAAEGAADELSAALEELGVTDWYVVFGHAEGDGDYGLLAVSVAVYGAEEA